MVGGVNEADCTAEKGRRYVEVEKNIGGIWQVAQRGGYLDIHDCSESLRSAWSTEIPGVGVISHVVLGWDEKRGGKKLLRRASLMCSRLSDQSFLLICSVVSLLVSSRVVSSIQHD